MALCDLCAKLCALVVKMNDPKGHNLRHRKHQEKQAKEFGKFAIGHMERVIDGTL